MATEHPEAGYRGEGGTQDPMPSPGQQPFGYSDQSQGPEVELVTLVAPAALTQHTAYKTAKQKQC